MQERAGDRLVIAFGVAVHAADALVVAADDPGQLGVEIDVGPLQQQICRRGEMRLMGPLGARQGAGEQAFADMLDLGVGSETVVGGIRSLIGSFGGPDQ